MQALFSAIAGVTAVAALALTYTTIRLQRRAHRDQAFLRLHEILLGDEMRLGRSLLIEAGKGGKLPDLNTTEHRKMTHALGGLDTAGLYIAQGLMPRDRFMLVWHHQLRSVRVATEMMADQRMNGLGGWHPWPHLWSLFDAAAVYYDRDMVCCQHEGLWPHSEVPTIGGHAPRRSGP